MQIFLAMLVTFVTKYSRYIIGAILLFFGYRWLGFSNKNKINDYNETGSSISSNLALAYAERLFNAMEAFGTDDDVMIEIYNRLSSNPLSVRSVYNAFGVREYGLFGSPMWFMPSSKIDLREWVNRELSGQNLQKWNSLFNAAGIV